MYTIVYRSWRFLKQVPKLEKKIQMRHAMAQHAENINHYRPFFDIAGWFGRRKRILYIHNWQTILAAYWHGIGHFHTLPFMYSLTFEAACVDPTWHRYRHTSDILADIQPWGWLTYCYMSIIMTDKSGWNKQEGGKRTACGGRGGDDWLKACGTHMSYTDQTPTQLRKHFSRCGLVQELDLESVLGFFWPTAISRSKTPYATDNCWQFWTVLPPRSLSSLPP